MIKVIFLKLKNSFGVSYFPFVSRNNQDSYLVYHCHSPRHMGDAGVIFCIFSLNLCLSAGSNGSCP